MLVMGKMGRGKAHARSGDEEKGTGTNGTSLRGRSVEEAPENIG